MNGLSGLHTHQSQPEYLASMVTNTSEGDKLCDAITEKAWPPWLAKKWQGKLRECNGQVMNHEGHEMLEPKATCQFLSSLHSQGGHPEFKKMLLLFRSKYYTDGTPTSQCRGHQPALLKKAQVRRRTAGCQEGWMPEATRRVGRSSVEMARAESRERSAVC
ncbi:hypothetical protein E2C01_011480 [Portunus trituberculatus]|uniref:Uncharacterized protein n=1 Tax=Portunus trituberculatus TaxID=210409 RepID=A0A5B7DBB3_PORTR|nr:hypothetical protein [Portunus trituberculatus]